MVCVPQSEQKQEPALGTEVADENAIDENEEWTATLSVYDMTTDVSPEKQGKSTIFVTQNSSVQQLFEQISTHYSHQLNTFEISLQTLGSDKSVSASTLFNNVDPQMTVKEAGINFTKGARNSLILSDIVYKTNKNFVRREAIAGSSALEAVSAALAGENSEAKERTTATNIERILNWEELALGASAASPTTSTSPPPPPEPPAPRVYVLPSAGNNLSMFTPTYSASSIIKPETNYVGLVNQAMTCYLNSLLQALFMTPEFRNALYKWEFDGKEGDTGSKSIPFQLQKLFLNLQTSGKAAVETTQLTRSFGWDSSEAWQQHDIQELCRVMFDALEHKFRKTDQADLISRLYEGKMIDYVKCLECSTEKQREDKFLDIPLPVRPFGSNVAYGSVVEALRAFVQPETLDGNNQYHCEKCNKKCDAHKGLKFTCFPYLLTLHLKRFDFDYSTLHRIKLNDKVVFPELLELNSFFASPSSSATANTTNNHVSEEANTVKYDDSSTTDSGSALEDENQPPEVSTVSASNISANCNSSTAQTDLQEDDEGIDVSCSGGTATLENNEKNARRSLEKGPFSYELFAIMIHSGSATGGHYYAYIKDFSSGQWFCFNDQSVSRITSDDIRKTFGGGLSRAYYSGTYSSSTNAYMLMYRQIDKDRNCEAMKPDEFPPHIKKLLQDMKDQEEKERLNKEKQLDICRIKVYAYHPTTKLVIDAKLYYANDVALKDVVATAHKQLGFEGLVSVENCRLVAYDKLQDSMESVFDGKDEESIAEILNATGRGKNGLLLEIKADGESWEPHKPGSILAKVFVVDLASEEVEGPHLVRANLSHTIPEFRDAISASLPQLLGSVPAEQLIVVLEKYGGQSRLLDDDSKTLKSENFYASNKVFVGVAMDEDAEKGFQSSKMHRLIDRYENIITLYMSLPDTDKESLEELSIPALGQVPPTVNGLCQKTEECPPLDISDDASGLSSSSCSLPETSNVETSVSHTMVRNVRCSPPPARPQSSLQVLPPGSDKDKDNWSAPEDDNAGGASTDQSASEDSSLTDSDRTLVGDPEVFINLSPGDEESPQGQSTAEGTRVPFRPSPCGSLMVTLPNSQEIADEITGGAIERCSSELQVASSPDDAPQETHTYKSFKEDLDWDEEDEMGGSTSHKRHQSVTYFRATPYEEGEVQSKMLKVQIDKRTPLPALKKHLEPYVGVPMDYFKLFRSYSSSDEFEFSGYNASYRDGEKLSIRLGRALKKGEFRGKVFQLCPGQAESTKFLFDWILAKGMLVADAKLQILEELKKKHNVEIPFDRCRLRKKCWKNPGQVYYDTQRFEDNMCVLANWEMFLQELPEAPPTRLPSAPLPELVLFVRRWNPSDLVLGPFQEIELSSTAGEELRSKLATMSEIPPENIEIAKGQGSFPCDISVLAVNTELEWSAPRESLNSWPLNIYEDGHIIFYRDCKEAPKTLTLEERKEIERSESSRVSRLAGGTSSISNYSPRKERALKIYLDATPPKSRIDCDVD